MDVVWNTHTGQSPILFKRTAAWQGLEILHHDVLSGELLENVQTSHEFNITLAGHLRVEKQGANGRSKVHYSTPGSLCLTPSGQPMKARWNERVENLAILIRPEFIDRIANENHFSTSYEIDSVHGRKDPLIQQIALTLLDEICAGEKTDQLYADTLSQSLIIHLLKNYSTASFTENEVSGGLSGYKLRRVKEFILDNLDRNLSLAEIAETADLSRFHFSREFRKATGMTPQHFLMHERVERAKILLANKDLPIVEVGLRTGFKSQSHFTTLFRKFTKLTPRNWRSLMHA
ncbi:MAG: helix-turn-helix transcriptional regulator [Acidobacteria bacterium]|nr:helix-turn-helix transcriptional regulator [Acidobacteriota bacterium]